MTLYVVITTSSLGTTQFTKNMEDYADSPSCLALPCLSLPVSSAELTLFEKNVEETCVHVTTDDL